MVAISTCGSGEDLVWVTGWGHSTTLDLAGKTPGTRRGQSRGLGYPLNGRFPALTVETRSYR
jgi:hypothetical protein